MATNRKLIVASIILILLVFSITTYPAKAQSVKELIKEYIESGKENGSIIVDGIKLMDQDTMAVHYMRQNYQPIWTSIKNRADMMLILNGSFDEGLIPGDYHIQKLNSLLHEIQSDNSNNDNQAKLDLLMSDAMVIYARHLIWGKIDQTDIRKEWDVPELPQPDNIEQTFSIALQNENLKSLFFDKLGPQHAMYFELKKGLKDYRAISAHGGWHSVPQDKTLKKGMAGENISALRSYLNVTGDLTRSGGENDAFFDETLEAGVKSFQLRHNLTADGIAGKKTLLQMNVSVPDRINTIRLNMERLRWVMHELEPDFLVVNIAGFFIRRITNNEISYESPVIVGKEFHESPIFKGTMSYIDLNPTWTLPYSISSKESLPRLKTDPNYLSARNMVIMNRNGTVLDPTQIDFSKYSETNFPFIIRQEPGPKNSLGRVKFMFPNQYAVYLHDTPSQSLFAREDRAFSHGCIRLEYKWELLMNLMDEPDVWNMEKIQSILDTEKTTRIKLKTPIDILILYYTAGTDHNGTLVFNRDVYNRDPILLKALNHPLNSDI